MVERSGGRVVLAVELQGPKVRVIMSLALKKTKNQRSLYGWTAWRGGEARRMVVGGLWRLGHIGICGLYSEGNGKPSRVWGQGRVRI